VISRASGKHLDQSVNTGGAAQNGEMIIALAPSTARTGLAFYATIGAVNVLTTPRVQDRPHFRLSGM
jgi:hypothetical protein